MDMPTYKLASFLLASALLSACDLPHSAGHHASGNIRQTATGSAPHGTHVTLGDETKAIAHIRFYDKDWAEGHNFCTVAIDSIPYTYTDGGFFGCTKDEARSAKLQNLPPGSTITLYDSPSCGDHDDYATIRTTMYMPNIVVGGFRYETHYSDWNMEVSYENGLMGKVSCAEVDIPGRPAVRATIGAASTSAK